MGWIMQGLDKEDYDRSYSDFTLLKRILGYFGKYKLFLFLIVISLTISSLSSTLVPVLISETLDKFYIGISTEDIQILIILLLLFSILGFKSFKKL